MILFLASDPGGINAVMPIYKFVKKTNTFDCSFYTPKSRYEYAKKFDENVQVLTGVNLNDLDSVKRLLTSKQVNTIITGTSAFDMTERMFWKVASMMNMKCGAVLDYWGNYPVRFSAHPTDIMMDNSENTDYLLPDHVFVMDDHAKQEMIRCGFEGNKLIVTGNPYFYHYVKTSRIKSKQSYYTLFSEPLNELYDTKKLYGFDEYTILEMVFCALEKKQNDFQLLVKPHPKQGCFTHSLLSDNRVRLTDSTSEILVNQSECVFGTLTMALMEGLLSQVKTIAVIPDETFKMHSLFYKKGVPMIASNQGDIIDLMSKEFSRDELFRRFNINPKSVEAILRIMEVPIHETSN